LVLSVLKSKQFLVLVARVCLLPLFYSSGIDVLWTLRSCLTMSCATDSCFRTSSKLSWVSYCQRSVWLLYAYRHERHSMSDEERHNRYHGFTYIEDVADNVIAITITNDFLKVFELFGLTNNHLHCLSLIWACYKVEAK